MNSYNVNVGEDLSLRHGVFWFTGLSGAGKTTIARSFKQRMLANGIGCVILDGDEMRLGISAGLGFRREDRFENVRRIAEVAKLFTLNGIFCVVSTISPYCELRQSAKSIIGSQFFSEVFINAPLSVCESRDVKGFYKMARNDILLNFTGLDDQYVPPLSPDVEIRTDKLSIEESVDILYSFFGLRWCHSVAK